jgi:hypothetical protein
MLTGLTVKEMYVYYTVATMHAAVTFKSIRLFTDIPLKAADRYFSCIKSIPYPFSIQALVNSL